ncbi:MAG TPA: ribbon-helix-helix protein, CopG family [Gaiella sp.]|nr:ribbon-helix-helix protein, CopG family [Gaiella sp.]
MKRTTIMFPDETAARVAREARRRGVSVAAVVREAVEEHLPPEQPRRLSFIGIVKDAGTDSSERLDEILAEVCEERHRDRT